MEIFRQIALLGAEMPCSLRYTSLAEMPDLHIQSKGEKQVLPAGTAVQVQVSPRFVADGRANANLRVRAATFEAPGGATLGMLAVATSSEIAVSFFDLADPEVAALLEQAKASSCLRVVLMADNDATLMFASELDGIGQMRQATSHAKRLDCMTFSVMMLKVIRAAATKAFCKKVGLDPADIRHVHIGWCSTESRAAEIAALVLDDRNLH